MISIDANKVAALLTPADAVRAIELTLRGAFDPADDAARTVLPLTHGEFLIMPSEAGDFAGVKVATVAPGNPSISLPRIQASYLLFDSATLAPLAVIDGVALTSLRTAAVSMAATRPHLEQLDGPVSIVVFGGGPAAHAHVAALPDSIEVRSITRIPRNPAADALDAIATADVIICATTAREPLFGSSLVKSRAVVIAVGSHEPNARELDGALLARSHVIVEDAATARREAGDVIQAEAAGHTLDLIPMKRAVTSPDSIPFDRPIVFKSTGMSWEDLAVAAATWHAHSAKGAGV